VAKRKKKYSEFKNTDRDPPKKRPPHSGGCIRIERSIFERSIFERSIFERSIFERSIFERNFRGVVKMSHPFGGIKKILIFIKIVA